MAEEGNVGRNVAGLWCSQVLARLPDVVDGTLGASELARVQDHVRACPDCERFGGRYGALVRTLRAMPVPPGGAPVEDILRRVMGAGG